MTEGKSHNVPSASKEMVVITDFSLTFVVNVRIKWLMSPFGDKLYDKYERPQEG